MKNNNLCSEIAYMSLNHDGEQLCGDHVEIVENDDSTIVVLADGLGSGVKASILSTLTSTIISTMLAAGLDIRDAVETIADTLPICSERKTAFSTFTIIKLENNAHADIIQYENPNVIVIRNGVQDELPLSTMKIGEKTIYRSSIDLADGDLFIALSDGMFRAWFVMFRQRECVFIGVGAPENISDNHRMMALFFAKEGKHIVCGGTTSKIAAEYLHTTVQTEYNSPDPDIPPISHIQGVDLVTEGIITVDRILDYAKAYVKDNRSFENWCYKKDGASLAARILFEDATDINMFIGHAANPAHDGLPINFNVKMQILKQLSNNLQKMGKRVKILDF